MAFKVVDGSGAPVGPSDGVFYTDAKGEIVIEGLESGTTIPEILIWPLASVT